MDFLRQKRKLVVYPKPINMHRSFNGLVSLTIAELAIDLADKHYILFMNRKRNQFKILFLYRDHISIFSMRISGALQADFTRIYEIDTEKLAQLIDTAKSRKPRLEHILGVK